MWVRLKMVGLPFMASSKIGFRGGISAAKIKTFYQTWGLMYSPTE